MYHHLTRKFLFHFIRQRIGKRIGFSAWYSRGNNINDTSQIVLIPLKMFACIIETLAAFGILLQSEYRWIFWTLILLFTSVNLFLDPRKGRSYEFMLVCVCVWNSRQLQRFKMRGKKWDQIFEKTLLCP